MVVLHGAGDSYEIGSGKTVQPGTAPPAWFTANLDMLETNGGGDPKCVELKDQAAKCMQEKGSYQACAMLAEAYNLCFANALQSRLPVKEQAKLKELKAKNLVESQMSDEQRLQRHMDIVRQKYEAQQAHQMDFAMGAAETAQKAASSAAAKS